jgi:dTDP-4-amino-4,6-dideoxygalactose transaminase
MPELVDIANSYGLEIIEDAAEGVGCYHENKHVGTFGRFGCFSFNGNKVLSTGGGGMIVCQSTEDADYVRHLSTQAKSDVTRFVHDEVGYNYRLSNMHAAVGVGQMEHLHAMLERRREIQTYYASQVRESASIQLFKPQPWCQANYWLTLINVSPAYRDRVMARAEACGIQARPFWELGHRQAPFVDAPRGEPAVSEALHAGGVCLPSHPAMCDQEIERVGHFISSLG